MYTICTLLRVQIRVKVSRNDFVRGNTGRYIIHINDHADI